MSIALVPLYINFMGIEAYGLVGFFATFQSVFSLLDMGLSTTLNREIARLSVEKGTAQETRNLVRTLEIIYWFTAGVIALTVVFLSPLISSYWINPEHLSDQVVSQAVLMMGLIITFEFPFALYAGGLQGLQQQILFNLLSVVMATLRGVGAVVTLWLVSPTIQVFFGWQVCVSLVQTTLSAYLLWQRLPMGNGAAHFRSSLLFGIWRFAAGMTGISILALVLTQLDKIILSKLLTLEMFGYYSLATVVASGLYIMVSPLFTAVFPRLSQLVLLNDEDALKTLYHRGCQLMSVVVLPVAVVVALFSPEILLLWTGDRLIMEKAHLLVSLLIIGTALNGLMYIPYALQLAHGWTKLPFYQNVVAVILLVPSLVWATTNYGAVGAAIVWVVLNAGYVLIGIQVMHTRLIEQEKLRWYYQDVALPLVGALLVPSLGRWLFPPHAPVGLTLVWLSIVSALALISCASVTPVTSDLVKKAPFIFG